MQKSMKNVIVIILGAFVSFLLMRFFRIEHQIGQYFSGWILGNSIISISCLLFGAITGGAIGLISAIIYQISYVARGFSLWMLVDILLSGLYGFILGKIFESKIKYIDEKNVARSFGLFILFSTLLYFLKEMIGSITIVFRYFRGNESSFGFIRSSTLHNLMSSLAVGIISLIIIVIYYKCLKGKIPLFERVNKISEPMTRSLGVLPLNTKGNIMLNFVRTNFRKWFSVYLWISLIVCILGGMICGGVIGKSFGGYYNDGHPIIGGIIGLLIGTVIGLFGIIVGGGITATFINIDENLEVLRNIFFKKNVDETTFNEKI